MRCNEHVRWTEGLVRWTEGLYRMRCTSTCAGVPNARSYRIDMSCLCCSR
jgi:hypothetical protein